MNASLAVVLCLVGAAPDGDAEGPAWIKAVTAPSKDLTLSFTRAGRIAKVLVREGQAVREGQLLVQLDDAVERMQLSLLKAKAESTTAVRAAEVRLERARSVLAKIQKAHDEHAAPDRELEDAKLNLAMAELDLEAARFEHEQARGAYDQAELMIERMRLTAPADAEVERIRAQAGEAVDALVPVIRLVCVEPLWVDVPAPVVQARRLAAGAPALVRFAGSPKPVAAKVVRVSRVADAASETLEVRVELPNPTGRPAGEQVTVSFPPPAGAAKAPGALREPGGVERHGRLASARPGPVSTPHPRRKETDR